VNPFPPGTVVTTASHPAIDNALHAWRSGRRDDAKAIISALVDECPEDVAVWALLARLHLECGDAMAAYAAAGEADAIVPGDPAILALLVEAEWRSGASHSALLRLAVVPPVAATVNTAVQLLLRNRFRGDQIPEDQKDAVAALIDASIPSMLETEEWPEIVASIHLLVSLRPHDLAAHCDLIGASVRSCGMNIVELIGLRRAFASARTVMATAPDTATLWNNLCALLIFIEERSHRKIGAQSALAYAFTRWMALEEPGSRRFSDARAGLADFLYSRRRMAECAALYQQSDVPILPELTLSELAEFIDRVDGVLAKAEALLTDQASPQAVAEIGRLIASLGLITDAVDILHLAHKQDPESVDVSQTLADILVEHRLLHDACALYTGRKPAPRQPLVVADD